MLGKRKALVSMLVLTVPGVAFAGTAGLAVSGTSTGNPYAAQGIANTSGKFTASGFTWTSAPVGAVGLVAGFSADIAFTLPGNAKFDSSLPPVVKSNTANVSINYVSGLGSGVLFYKVTSTAAVPAGTAISASFAPFGVLGATDLGKIGPTTNELYPLAQVTTTSDPTNFPADARPFRATTAWQSINALSLTPGVNTASIDVSLPSLGSDFVPVANVGTKLSGNVGTIVVQEAATENATNTGPFRFTGNATVTVTASSLGSYGGGFLKAVTPTGCTDAPATGDIVGTLSGNTLTFSVPPSATIRELCLQSPGPKGVMLEISSALQLTATINKTSGTANLGTTFWNGTGFHSNYYVGDGLGWASYWRIANRSNAESQVGVVVFNDGGTVNKGGPLKVPANQNVLFTTADINAATGSVLGSVSDRASVYIFGGQNIEAVNLLSNPGGTVTSLNTTSR